MSKAKPKPEYITEQLHPLVVPIDSVMEDPANTMEHPDLNLQAIAASLQKYKQRKPIVVNVTNKIVEAGNGTWRAAKEILGWEYIAAVFVEDDPHTAIGFSIADNRTAQLSDFNLERLSEVLRGFEDPEEIPGISADFLKDVHKAAGYVDPDELQEVPEPEIDRAAELQEKWQTAPGQIWGLGVYYVCPECGEIVDEESA